MPKCDYCYDTGYYGDNGPGIAGNTEYQQCDECVQHKEKGEKNGLCNRTACQSPHNVIFFNHSTRKYYCPACAHDLNDDPYNHRDAMRLYGHELCTRDLDTP
jgi:hypothetical protein